MLVVFFFYREELAMYACFSSFLFLGKRLAGFIPFLIQLFACCLFRLEIESNKAKVAAVHAAAAAARRQAEEDAAAAETIGGSVPVGAGILGSGANADTEGEDSSAGEEDEGNEPHSSGEEAEDAEGDGAAEAGNAAGPEEK